MREIGSARESARENVSARESESREKERGRGTRFRLTKAISNAQPSSLPPQRIARQPALTPTRVTASVPAPINPTHHGSAAVLLVVTNRGRAMDAFPLRP